MESRGQRSHTDGTGKLELAIVSDLAQRGVENVLFDPRPARATIVHPVSLVFATTHREYSPHI